MDLGPCPGENTLLDYAGGRLESAEIGSIDRHVDACPSCRVILGRWLQTEGPTPGVRAAPDAGELARGALLDRYVLLKPLGAGGMGLVFAAYDPLLDRTVAIKVLRHEVATAMPDSVRVRMLREARAMARLSHSNVVAVHDAGLFQGRVYLAMEHLAGGSLAEWLKARRRTWKEIRDVFVQAGRGLAAAHARGLVHRDFKPQNVLFSSDGRVLISDFGLVRPAETDAGAPVPSEAGAQAPELHTPGGRLALDQKALTVTGAVMGTPGYIAPELHRGREPDSRADQYSFCAALHLALHGRLPGKPTASALVNTYVPARVPSWLSRVVAKGLSEEPQDRYPSMDALLDDLAWRDRRLRRRAIGVAAVAVAVAAGGSLAAGALREPAQCRNIAERQAGVWGPEQRSAVRSAFERSGLAVARSSYEHVERALDRYASAWSQGYAGACGALGPWNERSGPFLPTTGCLDGRLEDLDNLVRVLSSANELMVREDAARAVSELPPPEVCTGTAHLAPEPPPPPPVEEKVRAIRRSLGEAWALYRAGDHKGGALIAEGLVTEARATRYPPILAETLALVGKLRVRLGRFKEGTAALKEATLAAEAAGKQSLAAELSAEIAEILVVQGQPEAAAESLDHGDALLAYLGRNPRTEASLLQGRGALLAVSGQWREAVPLLEQAASLTQEVFGSGHPRTAAALLRLAREMKDAADVDRARAHAERGRQIYEGIYGPNHPDNLQALRALGQLARDRGDYPSELDLARRVLDVRLALYGPESVEVASGRWNLASALGNLGEVQKANEEYRRALVIFERVHGASGEADLQLASLHLNIGWGHFAMGEDEDARAAFQRAYDLHSRVRGPDDPKMVHPLSGLGMVLAASGRMEEAMARFERALWVARLTGKDNADLQFPYLTRGLVQYEARQFRQARESVEAALPFVLISAPNGSTALALFEATLARTELADGQINGALARASAALAIIERSVGVNHPLTAQALTTVGAAHLRKGQADLAVTFLERAEQLRRARPCRPIERGETFLALARALRESGQSPDRVHQLLEDARAELARSGAWGRVWLAAPEMRH